MLDVAATIDALVERPSETVLLADYDGSLSPIVDRPDHAVPLPAAIDVFVAGFSVASYAGDDTGDLAAFAALARGQADGRLARAVRIGVRSPEMPPALPDSVDCLVDGPDGLVDLLAGVARAL